MDELGACLGEIGGTLRHDNTTTANHVEPEGLLSKG